MRERLRQFNGDIKIESDTNGTRIFVAIPLPRSAEGEDESSAESLQAEM
jgi:signal transduction histidine kinase